MKFSFRAFQIKAILVFALQGLLYQVFGQSNNYGIRNWNVADGLSQSTVMAIRQDRDGFLWIGTQDGLNRFSGNEFRKFNYSSQDPYSVSGDIVLSILADKSDDLIWIGLQGGDLNCFDKRTGHFEEFRFGSAMGFDEFRHLDQLNDSILLLTGSKNIYQFNKNRKLFELFLLDLGASSIIQSMLVAGQRILLLTSTGETLNYNLVTKEAKRFSYSGEYGTAVRWVTGNQCIYGVTNEGILQFNTSLQLMKATRYEGGSIEVVDSDYSHGLWVVSAAGLIRHFDDNLALVQNIDALFPDARTRYEIISTYGDRNGNLWLGTDGNGLIAISNKRILFDRYAQLEGRSGLINNTIITISGDGADNLYFGTWGNGIYQFNKPENRYSHLGYELVGKSKPEALFISDLSYDEPVLWAGTYGNGLLAIDVSQNRMERFHIPGNSKQDIYCLLLRHNGELWINDTEEGLFRYDKITKRFIKIFDELQNKVRQTNGNITHLFEDDNELVWIGTTKGDVYCLNEKQNRFDSIINISYKWREQKFNKINKIIEAGDNTLWIATWGAGLVSYNKSDSNLKRFTTTEGLPNNVIYSLEKDEYDKIWFSTNNGLGSLNPATNEVALFGLKDNLQSKEFSEGSSFSNKTDEIYFGGINGVNGFHPSKIIRDTTQKKAFITRIFYGDQSVEHVQDVSQLKMDYHVVKAKSIEIPYDHTMLRLELSTIDLIQSESQAFSFRLIGYEDDWTELVGAQLISYSRIGPGSYSLQVRAKNGDGNWSHNVTSLAIVVTPPWWNTTWAYGGYFGLLLVLIYFSRKLVVNRERLKAKLVIEHLQLEKMQELDKMRSTLFNNITHEFRTPISLIQGPLEKLIKDPKLDRSLIEQVRLAGKGSEQLSRLINQLLDVARIDAGAMQVHHIPVNLKSFYKRVVANFSSIADHKQIRFLPNLIDDEIKSILLDEDKLEKIVYNLLSNAIKFTKKGGEIIFTLKIDGLDNKWLNIKVSDTGIGIPEVQISKIFDRFYQVEHRDNLHPEGTGIGLALTNDLVTLLQGEITVESSPGAGTTFKVKLPVSLSNESEAMAFEKETLLVNVEGEVETEIKEVEFNVLIAEDNDDLQDFLRSLLSPKYRIRQARDGMEALAMTSEELPDIILSDLIMPIMDGNTLCQKLKSNTLTSHIPFIIITARADTNSKHISLAHGADDYLFKPFDGEELLLKVKNQIDLRDRLQRKVRLEFFTHPLEVNPTSSEDAFMKKLKTLLEDRMIDADLTIEKLSLEMGVSRAQLHRKLIAVTGLSPSALLRDYRLQRAADLLKNRAGNVSEVAYQVGIDNLSYFSKAFRQKFGVSPSDYEK